MAYFRNIRGWLALVLMLGAAGPGRADAPPAVVFPAESKPTAGRVDAARSLLDAHKWPEAVAEIQSILSASGGDLVPVAPGRLAACRRVCHALLAGLPPDALRSYRDAADPPAKKQLDQAAAGRDERLLRKVVDDAFCSRPGEKALDLLGDLAFERGDFAEAEQWWGTLLPAPKGDDDPAALHYPDPQIEPARTRAKILLARLFRRRQGWADDLESYRRAFPATEGELAGRKGKYADILRQVADERREDAPAATDDWPTFGGDSSRGRIAVGPPRLLEKLGALTLPYNERQYSLKDRKPLDKDPVYDRGVGPILANRSMAFEPVVADGKAIVVDANYVTAYDLATGAVETWYDAAKFNVRTRPDLSLPAAPDLRYTATVADGRLFVRLGTQTVRDVQAADKDKGRDDQSLLVCLSLRPTETGGRFLWSLDASALDAAVFEGSPLVACGRLYVAATHFVNGRAVTRVHCYPADSRERPQELWRQDVCETHEFADKDRRYRHYLLTLAGPYLVYCSHSGAVVALDALTGRPVWAFRYPSRGDRTADNEPSPRGLAPCLFADGRLYAAPADADRIFCFDPATGATLWQRGPIEVVQLLGVGEGRLIFTTPTGLRAVGAADGIDAWVLPDVGGLAPAGRGLLIGDLVLWPTASKGPGSCEVYAVRQRDGEQPDDPSLMSRIPAGNLVFADGCLLSADRQVLTVFTPPRMRLEENKRRSRAEPESAAAALELARAEADAGMTDPALDDFGRADHLAAGLSPARRRRLVEAVRQEKHALLLEAARRAAANRRWDEAGGRFTRASAAEFSPPLRLQALIGAAALWKAAGQPDRAAGVWRAIQTSNDFRGLIIGDGDGLPHEATTFATERVDGAPASGRHEPPDTTADENDVLHRPDHAGRSPFLRAWQAALDPGETPLAVAGDLLLCGRAEPSGRLTGRAADSGNRCWQAGLTFSPTWACRSGGVVLAAGARGAAGLRAEDGQVAWVFSAPPLAAAWPDETGTVLAPDGARDPLADFQLAGNRLFLTQGGRFLFALDAASGRVLWRRRAPAAGLRQPYPDGCYLHVVPLGAEVLLTQTGGRRRLIDAAAGRLLRDDPAAAGPWPRDPLPLPDGRVIIIRDDRTVALCDPGSASEVWTFTVPELTTRTGEAPRVLPAPDAILAAWPTNIGWRIQRLDRATGKPTWDEPPLVNVGKLNMEGWSTDADAWYGVQDRVLFARSLKDGSLLWEKSLVGPPGRWRTRRSGESLFAWPAEARGAYFQFRWLLGALQWEGRLAPEDESGRGFPVMCCDPRTGGVTERMNFPVAPQSAGRLDPDDAAVLPGLRIAPSAGRPLVSFSGGNLVVALDGRAWGLSAAK